MKLRRKLWLCAALCGAVIFGIRSCEPVKASAVDTVTLTPNQTRALFGDEIQFRYFDGSDYQYGTFTYQNKKNCKYRNYHHLQHMHHTRQNYSFSV